jgi:hypothetical protein
MAEVGLLPFSRIALEVCRVVLPPELASASTSSQLLAILCLERYEDWIFREAEVRLGKHPELRETCHNFLSPTGHQVSHCHLGVAGCRIEIR